MAYCSTEIVRQITSRSCLKLFYLSVYIWLFCVIFSLNGIAIANCCFPVICNFPYSEQFYNKFPFRTQEQDPMTYWIFPCVLRQSQHLVIKSCRERDSSLLVRGLERGHMHPSKSQQSCYFQILHVNISQKETC